jgi:putative MFS transporter
VPVGWYGILKNFINCAQFDGIEMALIGFILPELTQQWTLTPSRAGLLGAIVFLGMAIGAWAGGLIADRYGRKVIFLGGIGLTCLFALLSAISYTFNTFVLCRFFVGIGLGATVPCDYALFLEFVPLRERGRYLGYLNCYYIFGNLFICGIAWLILPKQSYGENTWRVLVGLATLPGVLTLLIRVWVPESPRYLLASGQEDKALTVMRTVATMNNRANIQIFKKNIRLVSSHQMESPVTPEDHSTSKRFFGLSALWTPELKVTSLLLWAIWFLLSYGSWGYMFLVPILFDKLAREKSDPNAYADKLNTDNVYLSSLLVYFVALFGYVVCASIMDKIPRRVLAT